MKTVVNLNKKDLSFLIQNLYKPLTLDNLAEREYKSSLLNTSTSDISSNSRSRNDLQRDYCRILYSSSFRRLQGKMQLLTVDSNKFYRNRLTHSLEVAQIARSIAEDIRNLCINNFDNEIDKQKLCINNFDGKSDIRHIPYFNDVYVVEAAALAHDLGNPPFGHHGERILNKICCENGVDGFEGNAQTLRILRSLEKKLPKSHGLNLTYRTLASVVKYNAPYKEENSKFIYTEDYNFINKITNGIKLRTLDAQILDIADEIAYAAHDLEDALSMKFFNLDDFLFELKLLCNDKKLSDFEYKKFQDIVLESKKLAEEASLYKSSEEYDFILRKEITSKVVNTLISDIKLLHVAEIDKCSKNFIAQTCTANSHELNFKKYGQLAHALKTSTFHCVCRGTKVKYYEEIGSKVLEGLFKVYSSKNELLPIEYRSKDKLKKNRLIIDYISGLMDSSAIQLYSNFYGDHSAKNLFYESHISK